MLGRIRKWGEFVKFSHTVFALPFALASMLVAAREQRGWPGWRTFGLILLAMVSARTAAMAFNRIMDRDIDALNPRTAGRHLPTGQLRLWEAWGLWGAGALGLVVAAGLLNPLCLYLSPLALGVVCLYSVTKRFTDFTHVYLGLALGLAPIGAWLAVRGTFSLWPLPQGALLPLLLSAAVLFWLIGFDVIYAMQDYEFDRAHGLHSLVVRWGPGNALQAAFLSHMVMWGLLVLFGLLSRFAVPYFVGAVLILACLMVEHWLARRRTLHWVNLAFFRLNAVISLVFLAVVAIEVVFPRFRMTR
jgi:4-hydroxybenzoate polyprenyltransferase